MSISAVSGNVKDLPQTLLHVPETSTIQEFAFRRGQIDRNAKRGCPTTTPASPFTRTPELDALWAKHYALGRESTALAFTAQGPAPSPSLQNFTWAPLINVYTQDSEMPAGYIDVSYVQRVCSKALDGMEWACKQVEIQAKDSEALIVDVPIPVRQAMQALGGDNETRYNKLTAWKNYMKRGY